MREFVTLDELARFSSGELGVSDWLVVDQESIDLFARATGDFQWIHVDPARAAREMPGGRTIAHGYLTLSLIPRLAAQIYRVRHEGPILNYGLNKIRFTNVVPSGDKVRLRLSLINTETTPSGLRIVMNNVMEHEGRERPALVAESVVLFVYGDSS